MKIEDKWKVILGNRTNNSDIFTSLNAIIRDKPVIQGLYYRTWNIDNMINPNFNEATNEFHLFVHLLYKVINDKSGKV